MHTNKFVTRVNQLSDTSSLRGKHVMKSNFSNINVTLDTFPATPLSDAEGWVTGDEISRRLAHRMSKRGTDPSLLEFLKA